MNWSPKPLRPTGAPGQVSEIVEKSVTSKERSPIQRQRDLDGTPYTVSGRTCLKVKQPDLVLDGVVEKAIKKEEKKDPEVILKSYFEFHGITV